MTLKLIDNSITPEEIQLLAKWRKKVQKEWGETFRVTFNGTEKWIHTIIDNPEKMLFFVCVKEKPIGHVGFDKIEDNYCYIGNVIRGRGKSDGSMTKAIQTLIAISYKFRHGFIYLTTRRKNKKGIEFYKKIGFRRFQRKDNNLIMKYEKN